MKSKNLLLIAPLSKTFIAGQASLIRPYFDKITVLMPMPRFSEVVLRIPYLNRYFRFLKGTVEFNALQSNSMFLSPKFFTLPIDILQRRNCYFAARSCIHSLSKSSIHIDLIHAHFLTINGFVGATLKDLYGKPLILTAHGGDIYYVPFRNKWYKALAKYVLNKADQVIIVSQSNAKKLLSLGVSSNKLHVIPNGYNEKLFNPIPLCEARKKLGLPLSKKILLSVGNLVDEKGHTYLVDAMRIIMKKRNDVILVIAGSGSLKERLQKKTRKLGLKGRISFVGAKKHDEIPMWINASDLFVLPSLSEGFPTVIPEAMACGKPVIGTRVGGVPEAITSDDVGILVDPKDPETLAQAILEALDRKWIPQIISNYAKRYSWSSLVSQILEIYQQVLLCAQ